MRPLLLSKPSLLDSRASNTLMNVWKLEGFQHIQICSPSGCARIPAHPEFKPMPRLHSYESTRPLLRKVDSILSPQREEPTKDSSTEISHDSSDA